MVDMKLYNIICMRENENPVILIGVFGSPGRRRVSMCSAWVRGEFVEFKNSPTLQYAGT